jgi:SAM-dependent methyltransferase
MLAQQPHAVLPKSTKDEAARQEYVFSLGNFIQSEINPGLGAVYERLARPEFVATHDREPNDRHEVRKAMNGQVYYQLASSMQRTTQEMLWNSVDESVQRQLPQLVENAQQIAQAPRLGTLALDPAFKMPGYIARNDNHAMPGGYSADLCQGDITAGALYDRGGFIYTQGLFGARMDGLGRAAINFVRSHYPDFVPTRIVDIGCTTGAPTVAFAEAWPEAETHGIDVGAALLRYAHARAESLGVAVHFHQASGENTGLPGGDFDLVTCLATLHETSRPAVHHIFSEAYRLLRPGGLFVVAELPPYEGGEPFDLFARDWDTWNNNEPFWGPLHEMDLPAVLVGAGFDGTDVRATYAPGVAAANDLIRAVPVDNEKFVGSTRGGGESWYLAARKAGE